MRVPVSGTARHIARVQRLADHSHRPALQAEVSNFDHGLIAPFQCVHPSTRR